MIFFLLVYDFALLMTKGGQSSDCAASDTDSSLPFEWADHLEATQSSSLQIGEFLKRCEIDSLKSIPGFF
jgi:hypothetical protein